MSTNRIRLITLLLVTLGGVWHATARADEATDADEASALAAEAKDAGEGKPLEGVTIEALESYGQFRSNELGVEFGIFPFNSYFTGFSLTGFYDYHINKTITWEILNASYVFAIGTDLTSQLAQDYNVNPQSIEKLQYLVSTDFLFTFTRGKLLLLGDYIRNFSADLIVGVGLLNTTAQSEANGQMGLAVDGQISDTFSWRLEFRDMVTISGRNFAYFTLGTGVNF